MHYCVLLITKEFPSESEIDEIMQPYCYSNIEYDEDTGEYASKPVVGTVRTKDVESIILSRTLTGIQALTDVLEAKDNN